MKEKSKIFFINNTQFANGTRSAQVQLAFFFPGTFLTVVKPTHDDLWHDMTADPQINEWNEMNEWPPPGWFIVCQSVFKMALMMSFVSVAISILYTPFLLLILCVIFLASIGKSLGVRKLYVNILLKLFEVSTLPCMCVNYERCFAILNRNYMHWNKKVVTTDSSKNCKICIFTYIFIITYYDYLLYQNKIVLWRLCIRAGV